MSTSPRARAPTILEFERFEFKYFIDEALVDPIRTFTAPFLRLDPTCQREPSGTYVVTNLYWDSPAMDLYWDHVNGSPDRFKLRIRSYGDETSDSPCFFEVKRKVRNVVVKHRAVVLRSQYDAVLDGDPSVRTEDAQQAHLDDFMGRMIRYGCSPNFLIRYEREAYENVFDEDARITFDRSVRYQPATGRNPSGGSRGWTYIDTPALMAGVPDPVLLELKFGAFVPAWMGELVRRFELRRTQFSKYLSVATHFQENALALADDQRRPRRS